MKDFVHLHLHTQYSMLDGATRMERLFSHVGELGQSAVAITDHGNMHGVLEFCKAAVKYTDKDADFYEFMHDKREFKIKPIVGCELYLCDDMDFKQYIDGKAPTLSHIVLLAKNEAGYHNLVKLSSYGYTRGFYGKPRIDKKLLKQYAGGLICLSACLAGELPRALLENNFDKADALVIEYKKIFGDDYYIELQDHGIDKQKRILPHLVQIARKHKVKLVASNDVHYLKKDDWKMQRVLQAISFKKQISMEELDRPIQAVTMDADGMASDGEHFPPEKFHVKSRAEMEEIFSFVPDALDNTVEIAKKCDCYYFSRGKLYPTFSPPKGETTRSFLRKVVFEGLEHRYKTITEEIKQRAEYEIGVIERMGFVDYFLVVWDFIAYAERQKISVGPGRGSGVGSIVAYALGITKLDPLRYELLFERFLNPERVSSPDFDIDFCVDRRDEVIQYVVGKYGADNVCQIITFGSLAAKAAVKDVARVFSLPFSESDKITKLMPSMMGKLKLRDLVDDKKIDNEGNQTAIPDLLNLYRNDETVQKIIDMAMQIEGLPRQSGVHAAGVIICKNPVSNHVPLAKSKEDIKTKESYTTTQFNMNECEELGLLKMDFLGLRTLTDIQKALDIIENNHGKKIDFYTMEYDDPLVYDMIGTGDTHAVFQLESGGMKMFMRDLKPTVFEDIIAGVALYRPGPMQYIKQFALGKRDPRTVKFDHSLLEPIFKVTYGIMAYQEQVMQAVQVLAGYTLGRADELRRMISKKKSSLFAAERKIFLFGSKKANIPGAIANGIPEKIANKVYDDIVKFADYAFNKSHAAAYAALAYQTAYLKTHYLVEFITAVLNNRISSIDEITNYLGYLKSKGKQVLLPDINKSLAEFSVEDGAVRVGLAAIKNVGEAVVSEILAERNKSGKFKDFEEFVTRMINRTVNKRMLESLILAGAFDCFGNTRHQLMQVYDGVIQRATKDKERGASGQFSLFDAPEFKAQKVPFPHYDEYDILLKLQFEKESAGVYLSGHPLDGYAEFLNSFPLNSSHFQKEVMTEDGGAVLLESEENSNAITDGMAVSLGGILSEADIRFTKKGNKEIGIGKIEDLAGTVDIMLSSMVLTKYKSLFQRDKLVKIKGSVKIGELGTTVWVNEMVEVSKDAASGKIRKVCFKMDMTDKTVMGELDEILLAYKGADEAYIRSTHDGKLYKLDYGVHLCDTLQIEVNACIGEGNIVVSEKK